MLRKLGRNLGRSNIPPMYGDVLWTLDPFSFSGEHGSGLLKHANQRTTKKQSAHFEPRNQRAPATCHATTDSGDQGLQHGATLSWRFLGPIRFALGPKQHTLLSLGTHRALQNSRRPALVGVPCLRCGVVDILVVVRLFIWWFVFLGTPGLAG